MNIEELQQHLLSEIDRAFMNNRYPGDHGIGGEEVNAFRGNWSAISLETMRNNRSEIFEFSTEGFVYYLPAFLKAIITHSDKVDTLADMVLHGLIPPEVPGDRFLIKVVEELNTEQQSVIRDFFKVYPILFPSTLQFGLISLSDLRRAISFWSVLLSNVSIGERKEVLKTIDLAWKDAAYPGDNKIVNLPLRDDARELYEGFVGKHWRDISLETLIANRDNISFFTLEAFVFYLPAFMTTVVLHYEIVDVLYSNTIFHLSPALYSDEMSYFNELVTKFNGQQKRAIRLFLEICAKLDLYDFQFSPLALRALDYWQHQETS